MAPGLESAFLLEFGRGKRGSGAVLGGVTTLAASGLKMKNQEWMVFMADFQALANKTSWC